MLQKVVQMGCDVYGVTAHSAHWISKVAVVEQDVGVFLESLKLFGCASALAIEVYALTYGEVLIPAANNGAESHCSNDYSVSASVVRILENLQRTI